MHYYLSTDLFPIVQVASQKSELKEDDRLEDQVIDIVIDKPV